MSVKVYGVTDQTLNINAQTKNTQLVLGESDIIEKADLGGQAGFFWWTIDIKDICIKLNTGEYSAIVIQAGAKDLGATCFA